ncbi:Na+/H+ antiporter subunit E [Micromonospora radicis]|uniref:Cation transporter n=1 Tax=Micromonospora radicis TaxID=1894971 RepID=A0A418MUW4_9ACTN|nr:Na+/H+ antiporter subunit E [Micromonospora radicis]RIV38394.1 cation transporter [Micromonospora radicis]
MRRPTGGTSRGTPTGPTRRVAVRAGRVLRFTGYFAVRLCQANLAVAWEILTPGSGLTPGVVRVPLRAVTDTEVAAVALAVSLTPGTLTLAIHRDPTALSVHGMYAADPVAFRRDVAELERRVLAAIRPADHPAENGPDDEPPGDGAGVPWRWR